MSRNYFDFNGKIALVAGASRGIGQAIAIALGEHGAHVIALSRGEGGCNETIKSIHDAGGTAEGIACHIGRMDDITKVYKQVDEVHGTLDILVNNAAANPYYGHILETDAVSFEKTIDVNLRGYFFMCLEGAKRMKVNGGGSIVNVASVNGVTPGDKQGIYSITKAGIINMSKAFARECGEFGIRVNSLVPGLTQTQFAQALHDDEEFMSYHLPRTPLGRAGIPEEMASAVLYLASDASSYTTGSSVVVDGGYLA
jgi:NAD(P)-dependent dehydrogenase (short-subunit alcohol dehydrogenase family)